MADQVIVVGGGLAGLSAAHTAIERGRKVTLIERNPFCGGNSTKATSGINGAPTNTQQAKNIADSTEAFLKDVAKSAALGDEKAPPSELAKVMVYESAPSVQWLQTAFGLDLSILGRLGGHSFPRTHRGKEKFPGMTITYGLMEKFEKIEKESNGSQARLINKATVTKLIEEGGKVVGVEYEKGGQKFTEKGVVILATGGYGADFTETSLLKKYRPDVMHYATTNGDHCNGSGIKLSESLGGDVTDMEWVQVHPTGLVNPKDPNNKVKWLAAEALRGCGGIILNADGERFCDELGRRDYVTGMMNKNKGPFRLILNGAASNEIEWHCKHYVGRGLMKRLDSGKALAAEFGVPVSKLQETFEKYNAVAKNNNDPWGKKFFANLPLKVDDFFHVAQIVPVVHYTMGGIKISADNKVRKANNEWVNNLWAVGEVSGGTHGKNRLGGNSLLDCVVHGRVAGRDIVPFVKQSFQPTVEVVSTPVQATKTTTTTQPASSGSASGKAFTEADVAKHSTEHDCWVILYDEVYNVTKFLDDHPGGKDSIMLYAGKDATEQFDMLHQRSVLEKFGKDMKIGALLKPKL